MNKIHLSELTLENVGRWPILVKIGGLLGVCLFIMICGYWYIIRVNFAKYNHLKAQEMTLKTVFENKQRQIVNLEAYRQQLKVLNEQFAAMLKQLSAKNEMPGLLEEISKTGVATGLKFELFAPQPELKHDFYVELPIQISMVGSYFQLAVFLSRIAEMNQIVTLHDFSIERVSPKENQVISADELVMNITAKIYRYRFS